MQLWLQQRGAGEGEFSAPQNRDFRLSIPLQKAGRFGGPEVIYHRTYSAGDWLPTLRISYSTQNVQRKHRTDLRLYIYIYILQKLCTFFYTYEVLWSSEKNEEVALYETPEGSLNGMVALYWTDHSVTGFSTVWYVVAVIYMLMFYVCVYITLCNYLQVAGLSGEYHVVIQAH